MEQNVTQDLAVKKKTVNFPHFSLEKNKHNWNSNVRQQNRVWFCSTVHTLHEDSVISERFLLTQILL